MSQGLAGGVSTHPSKSFPAENFFVIPPAGVYRSGEKRPPCDGGLPLGKNSRRSPGTSRRFLYTSPRAPPSCGREFNTTQCTPVPFTLRAPSALPSLHSVLQCSLLPFSAFQARTGVCSSVTGHRPLPGEISLLPPKAGLTADGPCRGRRRLSIGAAGVTPPRMAPGRFHRRLT